jgi:hypothetical protein
MQNYTRHAMFLGGFGLIALAAVGQGIAKPTIGNITTLPSEPVQPGSCTSSTAGYLEKAGRTKLTDSEIGHAVSAALKDGYVVTLYPQTNQGLFVNYECLVRSKNATAP